MDDKPPADIPNLLIKRRAPGAGRPRKEIDWDMAAKLCAIFCTLQEVAAILEVGTRTIQEHMQREGTTWEAFFEEHSAGGKASLRRAQWTNALNGNPTLQIWLGKQHLDQKDVHNYEHTGANSGPIDHRILPATDDWIAEAIGTGTQAPPKTPSSH